MKDNRECELKKMGAKLMLGMVSMVAEKNAQSLCKGFLYEPKVPKNLRNERDYSR